MIKMSTLPTSSQDPEMFPLQTSTHQARIVTKADQVTGVTAQIPNISKSHLQQSRDIKMLDNRDAPVTFIHCSSQVTKAYIPADSKLITCVPSTEQYRHQTISWETKKNLVILSHTRGSAVLLRMGQYMILSQIPIKTFLGLKKKEIKKITINWSGYPDNCTHPLIIIIIITINNSPAWVH